MSERKASVELRKFALVMTAVLGLIAALLIWRQKPTAPYIGGLAGLFLMMGLFLPRILAPVEGAWMRLAHILGTVMTFVILTLTFYLVVTPMGLLVRLLGEDLLKMKFDRAAPSYWAAVDPQGPCSRPDKPY